MKKTIHAVSGAIALVTIVAFWTSTVTAELFGSPDQVAAVKTAVLYSFAVLIPAMAFAGGSGFSLGANWRGPVVSAKKTRMKIIAATGLLVLVPSAIFLAMKAGQGAFDTAFMVVQGIELIAGASNITLLALNMRDGMAMRRPKRKAA
ncbi:hypothetical protein [Oricola sp.]|uniref:hypothetical protein n=1 Tax=Oricola sp. TaxID=1979950 RepID=UPI0025EDDFBA|nr:hypothetical protein [Oricola sp.]MCI5074369.1 hypothetical protein [Oricola sp.]